MGSAAAAVVLLASVVIFAFIMARLNRPSEGAGADAPAEVPTEPLHLWFARMDAELNAAIEAGEIEVHAGQIDALVKAIDSELGWELGPGRERAHALAVHTGDDEGRRAAMAWLDTAEPTEHFEFYVGRQAVPLEELQALSLEIGGTTLAFADVRVEMKDDDSAERIDVVLAHGVFDVVPAEVAEQVVLIVLDNALGEVEVEAWIGAIDYRAKGEGEALDVLIERVAAMRERATGEQWAVMAGERSEQPTILTVNQAAKRSLHLGHELHASVTMPLPESESGLGNSEHKKGMTEREDAFYAKVEPAAVAVAMETWAGRRTLHFYVRPQDLELFEGALPLLEDAEVTWSRDSEWGTLRQLRQGSRGGGSGIGPTQG